MSYFLGHCEFVKMILFVFVVFILLQSPVIVMGELSGREELVKWAGYGEEKLSTVVIGGKLVCHGAAQKGKTSIHPYPVSGAELAVLCGRSGKTKKSWARGSTDNSGYFLIDLPSHLHAIPNLDKICVVKVVHLPTTSPCRQSCIRKHKPIKLDSIGFGPGARFTVKDLGDLYFFLSVDRCAPKSLPDFFSPNTSTFGLSLNELRQVSPLLSLFNFTTEFQRLMPLNTDLWVTFDPRSVYIEPTSNTQEVDQSMQTHSQDLSKPTN